MYGLMGISRYKIKFSLVYADYRTIRDLCKGLNDVSPLRSIKLPVPWAAH